MIRNYLLGFSFLCALSLAGCSDTSNQDLLNHARGNNDAGRDGANSGQGDARENGDSESGSDAEVDASQSDVNLAPDPLVGDPDIEAQLRRPVTVMTDDFGMPHVFAESLEDLFFINGFTYASNRFAQMEFYRRIATGTLAELFGEASADARRTDILMRTLGLKRNAERYLRQNYDPNSESYQALMAYCSGVNAYLAKYRAGEVALPGAMGAAMPADALPDWQPADVMALSKLLSLHLTYSAPMWIEWHGLRQAIWDTFGVGATDPAHVARRGFLADVLRLAPATDTTHIDGLPDGQTHAIIGPNTSDARAPSVDPALISRTLALHDGLGDLPGIADLDIFGRHNPLTRGSNNWVLAGELTDSGYPTVANDPHLGLSLPTAFYPIHLELNDDIDGRESLKIIGGAMMGLPGVTIGRTDEVGWGAAASNYDYTDVYAEQISQGSSVDAPATVAIEGNQVAVERISEPIKVGTSGDITETVDLVVEVMPHHGPILPTVENGLPVARSGDQALSVRWAGFSPNNEMVFWMGLWRARTPQDAEAALDHHGVGLSNFVFGFSSGQTYYSGQSNIPQRQAGALNYDPLDNPGGNAPIFILPGSGGAEWTEFLDDRRIPHAYNSQKYRIITANNDPAGVTLDNNPFDDAYYLGAFFDIGFRAERIAALIAAGTLDDTTLSLDAQIAIQNDTHDPAAERTAQMMVNAIDLVLEASLQGTDDAEVQALLDRYAERIDDLTSYRDLLDIWDYASPATRAPTGADVGRSAAASLFNAAMVRLLKNVYADEFDRLGFYREGAFEFSGATQVLVRSILYLLEHPEDAQTYDETVGDSSIFDDLGTPDLSETRVSALVDSVVQAADRFERDDVLTEALGRPIPSPGSRNTVDWIWGKMHGLVLDALVPTSSTDFQMPQPERGLPFYERGGGEFSVNPCPHGYNDFNFSCATGAAMRMIHDMNPNNPVTYNAIAGGYSGDPESPYFMSEFQMWQRGEARKLEDEPDVLDANGAAITVYNPH